VPTLNPSAPAAAVTHSSSCCAVPPACAEPADQVLAVVERYAARINDDTLVGGIPAPVDAAGLGALHEGAGGGSPEHRRVRLAHREPHRPECRTVHTLACDHVPARIDDADRERERLRLGLCASSGDQPERDVE
jgi:hypothetical protein